MNRIIAIAAAVLIVAGAAAYFLFMQGPGGGSRVTGEELRAYVEKELTGAGATFESVTYDGGSDTVTVTNLDAPNVIPFYKTFKAAKFEIKGGDKNALELLFDEAKAKKATGDDFRRVAKKMRAENVSFELDMSSMAKAAAAASGKKGAEIEADIDKSLGGLDVTGSLESISISDYATKPTGETLATLMQAPDLSSPDALRAFMARIGKYAASQKFGSYEVEGLKYSGKMEEANIETTVEFLKADGYEAGVLGKTEMGPTAITIGGEAIQEDLGGSITATMESAMLESADMAKMLAAMQDGSIIPENPEKAPILNAWAPTYGDYRVSNVKVSIPGKGDFTLDEVSATDVKNVAGLALGGKFEMKNLVIPATVFTDSDAKSVLDALGAEALRINVSSSATFDDKKQVWDVSKFVIDVDKFGALNTQFRFGGMGFLKDLAGVTANDFMSGPMRDQVLQQMTFARLQLTYRDQGAVSYLLDEISKQSGMDRAKIAEQYVQQFDAIRAQFGQIPALDGLSAALSTFLKDPKSLTLKFEPEKPVPLGEIASNGMAAPGQLVEKLGFSAEANK